MIVRAYFLLANLDGGDPALVPVLRTVPRAPAAATAAMRALLEGPTAAEAGATPGLTTTVPAGTTLLGVRIDDGLATVDLSREFETAGGSFGALARLAQVVYTLTQFSSIDRVNFELEGTPVTVFTGDGIILDEPVVRSDYYDEFLPPIFVDRPAWGAALPNPSRIVGLSNVFEATFQLAVLDRDGAVRFERTVTATCGTGCWGRFDVPASYTVDRAQWGTLRVWVYSPRDGQPEDVREYPVWLLPAS